MPNTAVLDRTFDALANEDRRQMVRHLTSGPASTPSLATHFSMSKQALHRHLQLLERAGLVERQLEGRVHQLTLVPAALDNLTNWASDIRRGWEASLDRLGNVLSEQQPSSAATRPGRQGERS